MIIDKTLGHGMKRVSLVHGFVDALFDVVVDGAEVHGFVNNGEVVGCDGFVNRLGEEIVLVAVA